MEEFSDALVNTLPKDAAAVAAAHGGIGDTLLRKQQQHNALLQCLHSAGVLATGAYEVGPHLYPPVCDVLCSAIVFTGFRCPCTYDMAGVPARRRTPRMLMLVLTSRSVERRSCHHRQCLRSFSIQST